MRSRPEHITYPDVLLQLLLRLQQIVELSNLFGIDRTTVDRVVVLHPAEKLGRDGRPLLRHEAIQQIIRIANFSC